MHVGCVGYVYLCVCVTPPPTRHFKQLTLSSVCVFPFSTPRTGAGSHEEPCQERPIHFQLSACLAGMKSLLGFDKTFIKAQHGRGPARLAPTMFVDATAKRKLIHFLSRSLYSRTALVSESVSLSLTSLLKNWFLYQSLSVSISFSLYIPALKHNTIFVLIEINHPTTHLVNSLL